MASPDLLGEPDKIGPDIDEAHCARLVLGVYTAVMASSRNDRAAFDAAVQTYRGEFADRLHRIHNVKWILKSSLRAMTIH